jgi:hypothetical protein
MSSKKSDVFKHVFREWVVKPWRLFFDKEKETWKNWTENLIGVFIHCGINLWRT